MKSVFFRRLLIVMVIVMMLTTIAMALGCGVVGIKIYENITLEEMMPKAGTVADLVRELGYGHISREAFLRIAQSYVEASDSTTLVFSKDKEIILAANMPDGEDEQEVYSALSDTMDKIVSGDTVKSESLAIKSVGDTLSAKRDQTYDNAVVASPDQFDAVWDEYISDYLSAGGQDIMDERAEKWEQFFGSSDMLP